MATYIVKPNQNLFDVALHIYGSVEGIFDLLISNPQLGMSSELSYGQKLEYHEEFVINAPIVNEFRNKNITPSSGERKVYFKRPEEDLLIIVEISPNLDLTNLTFAGEGVMIVDWGDNSPLEYFTLKSEREEAEHYFNSEVETRRIKIYGNPDTLKFTQLDTTKLGGSLILCRPLIVDEYTCVGRGHSLLGLSLFNGTYKIDLRQSTIKDLIPIGDLHLQELDLREADFLKIDVLDDYLEYIVAHHDDRRPCTVRLSTEPSERGFAAIHTILNEPEWNISDTWKFYINNKLYQIEDDSITE